MSIFNSSSLVGQGYVVATILMLFSIGIMLANQSISTGRKSFTTVTGKSSQVSLIRMKKGFKIAITSIVLFTFVGFVGGGCFFGISAVFDELEKIRVKKSK